MCCRNFVTWLNETSVSIKWLEEDDEEIEKWEVTDHPPSSDSAWAAAVRSCDWELLQNDNCLLFGTSKIIPFLNSCVGFQFPLNPQSQFSLLKTLFDLKIIWLISQVLPLFWILDPLLELGIKTKANTSISISSLIQPWWWCLKSLFSGVICSVLVWCPGSGCDARLVRAGANFVHI